MNASGFRQKIQHEKSVKIAKQKIAFFYFAHAAYRGALISKTRRPMRNLMSIFTCYWVPVSLAESIRDLRMALKSSINATSLP
jgi:hypothetical protein